MSKIIAGYWSVLVALFLSDSFKSSYPLMSAKIRSIPSKRNINIYSYP